MRIAMLLLCLGAAACARGEEAHNDAAAANLAAEPKAAETAAGTARGTAPTPLAPQPVVRLAPNGLQIGSRTVAFGTAADEAVRLIGSATGQPPQRGTNNDCGAGPLGFANFPGGLNLLMQDGNFAGWSIQSGAQFRTAAGIGIGSSRPELDAAHRIEVTESTLGHEFTAGDLGGLLSSAAPGGRVEALWAGMTCHFR